MSVEGERACAPQGPQPPWTVLHLAGPLDLHSSPQLRALFIDEITSGRTRLVLDLTDVDFIDSTGMGVLVAALKRSRSRGGDVRLASASPSVARALRVTRLDRLLPPYEDADTARTQPPTHGSPAS